MAPAVGAVRVVARMSTLVIVPMTVVDPVVAAETYERLARRVDLLHLKLVASAETIEARLLARGNHRGSWPFRQLLRCVEGLRSAGGVPIDADQSADAVRDAILDVLGMELASLGD